MSRFFRRGEAASTVDSPAPPSPSHTPSNGSRFGSLLGRAGSGASTPKSAITTASDTDATTPHLILRPHSSVAVKPDAPASTDEATRAAIARLRQQMEKHIRDHYYGPDGQSRPAGSHADTSQLVEPYYEKWERRWLDLEPDETTLHRYLRAAKGNEADALKRLTNTLTWRRSFKPDIIVPSEVHPESVTGKHIISGFDNDGRSILYLKPSRENTKSSERQIRYVVWGLERVVDMLPPGQTKVTLAIDFADASQANNPTFATSLRVLNILQSHYVERLGRALVINPPWLANAFYSAIQPFIDPVTKEKVKWNTDLKQFIHPSQLPVYYGGDYAYEFDADVFWHEVCDFAGIAEDGTRTHESFAKMSLEEEARARSVLAAAPTDSGQGPMGDAAAAGGQSSEDVDEQADEFEDARDTSV